MRFALPSSPIMLLQRDSSNNRDCYLHTHTYTLAYCIDSRNEIYECPEKGDDLWVGDG